MGVPDLFGCEAIAHTHRCRGRRVVAAHNCDAIGVIKNVHGKRDRERARLVSKRERERARARERREQGRSAGCEGKQDAKEEAFPHGVLPTYTSD